MAAVGWDGRDVSGLSHEQIHRWTQEGASPEALAAARDRHLARADELRSTADRLRAAHRGVAESWIGQDADAAGQRTGTLASRMEQLAETVSGQARGVDGMRAALLRVQVAVGPPRPPALPPLGAPPVLGELRALVTGAPADGFAAFRAAAQEQAAAREAYRTYLTETAAAARGVATAGEGPPSPTAAPGTAPAPGGAAPAPGGAPTAGTTAPGETPAGRAPGPGGGTDVPAPSRGATPVTGARGAATGVLQRAAATPPRAAPPGDLPVGPRAVGPGPVPRGPGPATTPGAAVPAPPAASAPAASAAGPADAGRATVPGDGGVRPLPVPTTGAVTRRAPGRRRDGVTTRTGGDPRLGAGEAPATDGASATPAPASEGHAGGADPAGHPHPTPGPLDAAPLGLAPVAGGTGEHRLPPRRTEYLVDPDPAGWGADAARRVAPPVLGEDVGDDEGDGAGGGAAETS